MPFSLNFVTASLAKIAQPSIGMALVRIIESPIFAPEDIISLPFLTSPSITPDIKGRSIPTVISVWPPIIDTFNCRQASVIS